MNLKSALSAVLSGARKIFAVTSFSSSVLAASLLVAAQETRAAESGWSAGTGTFPTATEACRDAWQKLAVPLGKTRFIGAFDRPGSDWYIKDCSWTTFQYLAPQEEGCGVFTCSTVLPSIVTFRCESGSRRFFGRCVPEEDDRPERAACYDNGGANPNPIVGNPIVLSTGAKILKAEDFATEDGKFAVRRSYRSLPVGRSNNMLAQPLGLTGGWSFDFALEIQLGTFSGSPSSPTGNVSIIAPDGVGYDFTLQNDGTWKSVAAKTAYVSNNYRLEYVGTLPTNLADLPKMQTSWRVIGPDDRIWSMTTRAGVNAPTYFNFGRPTAYSDRDGYGWSFNYAADGRLESVTDTFGRAATFTWNTFYISAIQNVAKALPYPETIASILLPDGTTLVYSYDPPPATAAPSLAKAERLTRVERRDSNSNVLDSTQYHYDDPSFISALTGITDHRNVRVATYAYDDKGRAISTAGADGANLTTVAYSMDGNDSLRTVTNALGKQSVYRFAAIGSDKSNTRLTTVIGEPSANCPASASSYAYGTDNFVNSETDEEGRVTQYVRDGRGRPTLIRQAVGTPQQREISVTWDATRNLVTKKIYPGLTTDYVYDTLGHVTSIIETDTTNHTMPYPTAGQTRIWSYTYTPEGKLATIDGPLPGPSDTVKYVYDGAGNISSFTDELGHLTTVNSVNSRGQPTSIQDPNGLLVEYTYDGMGRLLKTVSDPADIAATASYEYDSAGNLTKIINPDGAFQELSYDSASRVTKISNNLDQSINYAYDALGNVTAEITRNEYGDPFVQRSQGFDELGRLISVTAPASEKWKYAYDKIGNLVSVTDPNGKSKTTYFDALNRETGTVDEIGASRTFTYDQRDAPISETDPRSLPTSYIRNGWGEVIQEESADAGKIVYVRNERGLITSRTDARGIVTTYVYDAAGRQSEISYPNESSLNVVYHHDNTDNGNPGIGRLTNVSDASGTVHYSYDLLGRRLSETRNIDGASFTIQYRYDGAGNVSGMTYPSGRIVGFERYATGGLNQVWTYENASSPRVYINWWTSRTPYGPVSGIGFANGLVDYRTFNENGKIQTQLLQDGTVDLINRWYSYQDNRNLTLIVDNNDASKNESYWYQANGFLQNSHGPWGNLTYWIDSAGNITHKIQEQGTTTTTSQFGIPSDSNRLVNEQTDGLPLRSFTSDPAGNILSDTGLANRGYVWNAEGQLGQALDAGAIVGAYRYDYLSRLTAMSPSSTAASTHYIYDQENRLIAEYDGSGALKREYLWLDDRPLAIVAYLSGVPVIWHVHTDHLGRPIMMTDETKAKVWEATYLPFGEVYQVSGTASTDMRFPGQWYQPETGLHYNWHRHYDPTTGRYLQPDPLGTVDGHRWAYADNSPLMNTDPEGLRVEPAVGPLFRDPFPDFQPPGYCPSPLGVPFDGPLKFNTKNMTKIAAGGGTPGNNQAQNKQVRDIVVSMGLNRQQQRELHDEISGQNLSFQQIRAIAIDMFGK